MSSKKPSWTSLHQLPDDLLISIFTSLSASATSPSHLINTVLTCKRFLKLGFHPAVLAHARALEVKAMSWSEGVHHFLKLCADAGNMEACYILGMIYFYCLHKRPEGVALLAKAALASNAAALYALAILQFNGSGGSREDKNLKSGVSLCARAAVLGYVDAIRELGHCVHDGYGVSKNVMEGRRLLLDANAREAVRAMVSCGLGLSQIAEGCSHYHILSDQFPSLHKHHEQREEEIGPSSIIKLHPIQKLLLQSGSCCLLSDFGCHVPPPRNHIANQFLIDWFSLHPLPSPLLFCSYSNCGRPETRQHEFRRCSACNSAVYCSRACQALDWKLWHKYDCYSVVELEDEDDDIDDIFYEDLDDS